MPDSLRRLPVAAGALPLLVLALIPAASSGDPAGCPPTPLQLAPKGGPGARFTMLIRINKPRNVNQYAKLQSTYGQLRTRDIFLVNTRWKGTSAELQQEIVSRLREEFPCTRMIALNGLASDPQRPGYALSLIDSPRLWGLLLDWERRDWGHARATNHRLSRWKQHFGRSLNRLSSVVGRVAHRARETVSGIERVGAVPSFYGDWHYGRIARMLDRRNRRFGHRRGGIQVVSTQASCMKRRAGQKGMRSTAGRLYREYRRTHRKRRNLAVQISFSDHGRAKRHLPIRAINESRAASCLRAALAGGAGAVLFWASPQSMWALAQTHHFRKLRHRH
ncbi:MAG TPA: hypothetical protein VIZ61_06580 [Solirubrobacterales bacterium]